MASIKLATALFAFAVLLIAWLAIHYGGDWLLKGGG